MGRMDQWKDLIRQVAGEEGIPAELLWATVATESSGKPDAYRFEPGYLRRYILDKEPWQEHYYKYGDDVAASYGLVQIMYPTAVALGFESEPRVLFDPDLNLRYGAVYIKKGLAETGSDPVKVATRYNTGSVNGRSHPGHIVRFLKNYEKAKEIYGEEYKPSATAIVKTETEIIPALRKLYEHIKALGLPEDQVREAVRGLNIFNLVLVSNKLKD